MKAFTILLSFAAAVLLTGCTLTRQHGKTTSDPFALAHGFQTTEGGFDYQGFCKELHIKPDMFARSEDDPPIGMDVFAPDQVGTNLWRMIVVRDGWNSEWQYLIFGQDRRGWRLIGRIDVPTQPYVEPDHRIERTTDDRTWLVLTYVKCWGTGIYGRKEAWYSLGHRAVELQREVALANES